MPGLALASLRPCGPVSLGALRVPSGALGPVSWLQGLSLFPEGVGAPREAPKTVWCPVGAAGAVEGGRGRLCSGVPAAAGREERISCASHAVAFIVTAVFVPLPGVGGVPTPSSRHLRCQRAHLEPMAVPLPVPGAPSKPPGGLLQRVRPPSLPGKGVVGREGDAPPCPALGSRAGFCRARSWHSSFAGRARGAGSPSKSPKLFGDTASPVTSSSSPLQLRHQTNPHAGTLLSIDVLFWFSSNLFPVDTAAALLELAGPEQG